MTTSNTPDQRIDEILEPLRNFAEKKAHSVTWEYSGDISNDLDKDTDRVDNMVAEARQQLKSLFETMCAEIVGENKHSEHKEWDCPCGVTHSFTEEWHATNKLRDEQRQRIPQVINKYFDIEEK